MIAPWRGRRCSWPASARRVKSSFWKLASRCAESTPMSDMPSMLARQLVSPKRTERSGLELRDPVHHLHGEDGGEDAGQGAEGAEDRGDLERLGGELAVLEELQVRQVEEPHQDVGGPPTSGHPGLHALLQRHSLLLWVAGPPDVVDDLL